MSDSKRSWFGVIFGMVFFCAGMAVAYTTAVRTVISHFSSADWVMVPTEIVELEFKNHHGSDSTTYSVRGRYTYYYNGASYTNTRVSFNKGSDNFGDYWQDLYARLNQDRRFENAMAWVNPDSPSESVLDRTFRWANIGFGAIFAVLFGGIGGFVAWASWRTSSRPRRNARLQRSSGLAQSSTSFNGEGISSKEKSGGFALIAFGGLFFAVGSFMSAMILPKELANENYPALLVLVFVLVGAGIMGAGIKHMMAYRRFGPTPLFLDPISPGVGGECGAWFVLASEGLMSSLQADAELRAQLCCLRRYKSGDDTKSKIIWKASSPVHTSLASGGVKAACKFDVPADCTPSREWSNRSSIEWELLVEGDFSSHGMGKLSRSWEVFMDDSPSSARSQITLPQTFLDKAESAAQKAASNSALSQINLIESGHHVELLSAAGRYIMSSIMGVLFGAIFAGMGVFTVGQDWWPGYIFIGVGALIGLASLFSLGSGVRARFDTRARTVLIKRSWFGIVFSSSESSIVDSSQFFTKRTSSTQSGSKSTEYYSLYIRNNLSDGKKHKVAESIEGEEAVEALKAELISKLF